jgi:hypothetical protein
MLALSSRSHIVDTFLIRNGAAMVLQRNMRRYAGATMSTFDGSVLHTLDVWP